MKAVLRFLWPATFWGKLGLLFVIAILFIAAAFIVVDRRSESEIAAHREWLKERGFPSVPDDLFSSGISVPGDAAVPLAEAAAIAFRIDGSVESLLRGDPGDAPFSEQPLQNPARRAAFLAAAAKEPAYEPALESADRAAQYYTVVAAASPPFNVSLAPVQTYRSIARVEAALCRAQSAAGDREGAVRRALRLRRLADKFEAKEPFLIAYLISQAIKGVANAEINIALRTGPIGAAVRSELDAGLATEENSRRAAARALASEMACFRENAVGLFPWINVWPLSSLMKSDIAYGMATLRKAIERHDRPNRELQDLSRELGADIHTPFPGRHYASAQLLPAFDAAHGAYCRGLAFSRALRILNALQARGDLALSFDQLGLPPDVLIDPFDGKPLRRKESKDGLLIYTVCRDLVDDGGAHDRAQDWGSFPVPGPPTAKASAGK
ncbi:MAG TPA: hypothetical protein VNC50_19255 [Planctomycetia bacterium]|nr:hypothetical protein [Planctomycetia bacterium]